MKRLPHPLVSAIPLVVLIGLLAMVIALFGSDSLSGGSQVSLLAAMAVCVFISMVFYREASAFAYSAVPLGSHGRHA